MNRRYAHDGLRRGSAFSRQVPALTAGLILASAIVPPARAERAETVSRAALLVERGCLITPPETKAQREAAPSRGVGMIVGTMLAGVAGDLVASGLNAAGSALEKASQEKAFVAEGTASFNFYVVRDTEKTPRTWGIAPDFVIESAIQPPAGQEREVSARCLIIAREATGETAPDLSVAELQKQFSRLDPARAKALADRLEAIGFRRAPGLYLEAELKSALDGMWVQPVLLRYGEPLPGAPATTETTAELDVSFAVPGGPDAADIGTLFSLSRIRLPKIAPPAKNASARVWSRGDLETYGGVIVPLRPTTGTTDDIAKSRNAVEAAIDTQNKQVRQLEEAARLAQRAADRATPAEKQKLEDARDDANLAVSNGQGIVQALQGQQLNWGTVPAGSTNVKARFLVIRDANEFGLALAKALKSQAEATGKAVTKELAPEEKKPAWTDKDTAYLDAQASVRAAQRALDDAVAKGEGEKLPGLQDAVLKAKALANEAAIAADQPLPYAITP